MSMNISTKKKIIGTIVLAKGKIIATAILAKGKIIETATQAKKKADATDASTKRKIIIAAPILTAALFTGSTYWAGKSAEQTFRDGIEEMARHSIKITLADYQRGVFGAKARTELVLSRFGENPVTLSFSHGIRHGPILSFASAASIRSELQPPEEFTALLADTFGKDPFGGKAPLTVKTTFGWSGKSFSRIVSPKFEILATEEGQSAPGQDSPQLSWGGLDGEIIVDSARSEVKTKIVIGDLTVTGNNGDLLRISRATFQSDMAKINTSELILGGTANFVLSQFTFIGTDEETGAVRAFAFENARGQSGTVHKEDGTLDLKIRFDADTLVMKNPSEITIGKPGATFLYENVDVQALEAILRAALGGDERQQNPILALEEQASTLMRRQPAFSVMDAGADLPEGVTAGSLRFAYTGDGNLARFSLADLAVDLQLELPIALLTRLLEEQSSRGFVKETEKQVAMLNSLIDKGALINVDGVLGVDASLENGNLTMNDQPEPLETLQEVLEFF
jgi:uncharacterized protein YdgA (DUF945 family)